MSHIFISYSTKNKQYAYRLAERLRDEGFDVWIDNDKLRNSANWWKSIVGALRACDLFVVIMTPESAESRWVEREVMLADKWNKPAFPLLLAGEEFEIYVATQFANVSDNSLPNNQFYKDLAQFSERKMTKGDDVTQDTSSQAPTDAAIQEALNNPPEPEEIRLSTYEILPPPFEWIEIPAGEAIVRDRAWPVDAFVVSKYPITNAQFAKFMNAWGYEEKKWWNEGWELKERLNGQNHFIGRTVSLMEMNSP